jgi:tetratricopeptide (TPR) repeat protein
VGQAASTPLQQARKLLGEANAAFSSKDLTSAAALAAKAIELLTKGAPADADPQAIEDVLIRLGRVAQSAGSTAAARTAREFVVESRERRLPEDDVELMRARRSLAVTLASMGEIALARDLFETILRTLERTHPEDDLELEMARDNLAITRMETGDLHGALALQEKVVAGLGKLLPPQHAELQSAEINLGNTLFKLGDVARARELFEKVVLVREQTLEADDPALMRARDSLAIALRELGDYEGARVVQERVVATLEKLMPEGHEDLVIAQTNLGGTLQELGDLYAARALLERSLTALEKVMPETSARLLGARADLALTLSSLGDVAAARRLTEKNIDTLSSSRPEEDLELQHNQLTLCSIMIASGELESARSLIEKSLSVLEKHLAADHPLIERARLQLAYCLLRMGDLKRSRELAESLVNSGSPMLVEDRGFLRKTRETLCWTLWMLGDHESLRPLLEEIARSMTVSLRSAAFESAREASVRAQTLERDFTLLLSCPDAPSKSVFSILETARARAAESGSRAGDMRDPEIASSRARAKELRTRVHDLANRAPGAKVEPEELRAAVSELDRTEDAIQRRLHELGRKESIVEADALANVLPKNACAIGFRLYSRMAPDADAPHEMRSQTCFLAHVLRASAKGSSDDSRGSKDDVAAAREDASRRAPSLLRIELGPADPIAAAVKRWRAALGKPLERGRPVAVAADDERAAGEELRRLVFDPLLDAMGSARELFVCVDDVLHLVPLDALPLDADVVGSRWVIHNESSFARLLSPAQSSPEEGLLLALGGIDYNLKMEPSTISSIQAAAPAIDGSAPKERAGPLGINWGLLPETRGEVAGLGALFHDRFGKDAIVLVGGDATKLAFETRAPSARFLHVATHGYFAPESVHGMADAQPSSAMWKRMSLEETVTGLAPMTLCGLALAGANGGIDSLGHVPGVMTAEELAGADLSHCELAVLSACETNVGITRAGQGIQSLQAALHAAGARTAITSLWRVDDERSRELFSDFYTRVWVNNEPRARALWNAKMALRKRGCATRDWATWMLTGDPN